MHDANTDVPKATLFKSAAREAGCGFAWIHQQMGTGTNVQTRLAAPHHLDSPMATE